LELRDIEYFAVIAEHKHLGRAAEALGLSVPAVSKSLRRLESAAETKLFKRTPKGVELTAEGAALLSHVRGLRVSLRDITRQLADLRQGRAGDLRVGASPGYAEYLLPWACSTLYREGGRVNVSVLVGPMDVTLPALAQGELDLVITEDSPAIDTRLVREPLYEDEVIVASAVDHPLAARSELRLADLIEEQWAIPAAYMHRQFCEIFLQRGLPPPQIALLANSSWLRVCTVTMSRLLSLHSLPTVFAFAEARDHLVVLPVKDLMWKRKVIAVHRSAPYLSPAAHRLIDALKSAAARKVINDTMVAS
jgi:DNA-binding transcriptional LysR family regulator